MGDAASQRDIVQSNFRNRATISRVIAGLERKGWLVKTRFQGDQKRFKLELTEEGVKIIRLILPHAKELRQKALNNIDEKSFKTFEKVLTQIEANYSFDKV